MPRRVVVAIAGAAFVAAGTTVVVAGGSQVWTSPSTGYPYPPASYDVSGGPATAIFSYDVKNLTTSPITTDDILNVSRIISYKGTDVSTGYPALTDSELAANFSQTTQIYNVITRSQTITVPASATLPVSFSFLVSQCGYYQMDSFGSHPAVSGLFATGFIRVIGCTAPPTPTPTPTPTPSPTPSGGVGAGSPTPSPTPSPSPSQSASPSASASATPTPSPTPGGGGGAGSPSPSPTGGVLGSTPTPTPTGGVLGATPTPTPTGGVQTTTTPNGGVLAASTPGTGSGSTGGGMVGLGLIGLGALLLLGALVAGRRPQPI